MIEVSTQDNGSRLGQFQKQHLVAWSVSRSGLDDNCPIAEHVVFVLVDDNGLTVLQRAEVGRGGPSRRRIENMMSRSALRTSQVELAKALAFATWSEW